MKKRGKDKKRTHAYEINRLISISFGIAFGVIYLAGLEILYLTGAETSVLVWDAFVMLGLYLILYLIVVLFLIRKINNMFAPLERFVRNMIRDKEIAATDGDLEKLAQSLSDNMSQRREENSLLESKLTTTRSDLRRINSKARNESGQLRRELVNCIDIADAAANGIMVNNDDLEEMLGELDKLLPYLDKVSKDREALLKERADLDESLKAISKKVKGIAESVSELKTDQESLEDMNGRSAELVEALYNDMAGLQSLSAQLNLYATNTAMDISRNGFETYAAVAAIDEMESLTKKILDTTDALTLMIIRIRNELRLSEDQTRDCIEKGAGSGTAAAELEDDISRADAEMEGFFRTVSGMNDDIQKASELKNIGRRKETLSGGLNGSEMAVRALAERLVMIADEHNGEEN
ncbi:MAG: hypothetical protein J6N47_03105 [Lachnospiraceae bacterium]|nr:hypothetical protein [Lachnospiraceae bacterium]